MLAKIRNEMPGPGKSRIMRMKSPVVKPIPVNRPVTSAVIPVRIFAALSRLGISAARSMASSSVSARSGLVPSAGAAAPFRPRTFERRLLTCSIFAAWSVALRELSA
jgi:hypothetical protein